MQIEESRKPQSVGLLELVRYFLWLGSFGFGGPIALAGYMQRDLVSRGWITSEEYGQGLAFAQMMPGPLAARRERSTLKGFVKGATAAASGAIAGAAVILAEGSIIDVTTVVIALASFAGLRAFKLPEPVIIGGAAIAGALLYGK